MICYDELVEKRINMPHIYYCPICKSEIAFGTKTCDNCGTPFDWEQFKPPEHPTLSYIHQDQHEQQQPKKRRTSLGLIALLCLTGLIVIGGIIWSLLGVYSTIISPSHQVNSSIPSQKLYLPPPTTATNPNMTIITITPTTIIITAEQLYDEYNANQESANAKYGNKIIQVTGIVSEIGIDRVDNPYIVLTGGGQDSLLGVQ
jgi:hypothetical protein